MVVGKPVSEVVSLMHIRYREQGMSLREMLVELGVSFRSFDSCENNNLDCIGAYLCTVPSLNMQGGNHEIVIELTDDDYFVLDPVKGRDGKFYYEKRGEALDDLAVELGGFAIDAFIPREWLELNQ